IHRHVGLAFDVDGFGTVLSRLPTLGSLIGTLVVEGFNVEVLHGGPDVRESPGDAAIMSDNYERKSGESHSDDVVVSRAEVRLIPKIGHLVVEVHIVREHRLRSNGVRS